MDTPYIRQYTEDREITAWFLLDLSPSVDFGTVEGERQKRTVLIDFVTTLARLLTRHGNRVGAIFYDDRVERTIPARGGRIQVLRLINDLLAQPRLGSAAPHRPRPAPRRGSPGERPALAGLRDLGLHQRARLGALARPAQPASRGHRRPAGRSARGRAPGHRAAHRRGRGDRRAALRRHRRPRLPPRGSRRPRDRRETTVSDAFKRAGVDAHTLSTDDDLVRAIVRMAARLRRRRRR